MTRGERRSMDLSTRRSSSWDPSQSSSLDIRGEKPKAEDVESVCILFNRGQSCDEASCEFVHSCAICKSCDHGWFMCRGRRFCQNYATGTCKRSPCDMLHLCMLCHGPHPMDPTRCSLFRERNGDPRLTTCTGWNSMGRCEFERGAGGKRCKFLHLCLVCGSGEHGSLDCDHALISIVKGRSK
jgi:hypothetical protein